MAGFSEICEELVSLVPGKEIPIDNGMIVFVESDAGSYTVLKSVRGKPGTHFRKDALMAGVRRVRAVYVGKKKVFFRCDRDAQRDSSTISSVDIPVDLARFDSGGFTKLLNYLTDYARVFEAPKPSLDESLNEYADFGTF